MLLCHTSKELAEAIENAKKSGRTIGFIPTMGALHEGHLSLVRRSQQDGHFTVVSVFVNPLQFGQKNDFENYPRTLGVDARLLTDAEVDVLFAPTVQDVFPKDVLLVEPEPGKLGEKFEGQSRPGHFAGMLKVVSRLFDLVSPDAAYFGEKDAQQLALVRQMTESQISLGQREPLKIVGCKTIREPSGLALASRNRRLSSEELKVAETISQALFAGAAAEPEADAIIARAKATLSPEARLDYLELVDPTTFERVDRAPGLLIIAAQVGEVRLIDNMMIGL